MFYVKNKIETLSLFMRVVRCARATAMVEFAYVAPLLLTLGLGGMEIATLASDKMKVSQIALSVADNAARLGQTDNSGVTPTISESSVDAILQSALNEGAAIDLEANGRIVISSLEWSDIDEKPYIHWQRCVGDLDRSSAYGNDTNNNGLVGGDLPPVGRGATKFVPSSNEAIMIVEVFYEHQGVMSEYFIPGDHHLAEEAGLLARDDRNLEPGLTGGGTQSPCD